MPRYELILADSDEDYIESLNKYIRSSYANKFIVNVFTKKEAYNAYINDKSNIIDILLVGHDFLCDEVSHLKNVLVLVLWDGKQPLEGNDACKYINKYQPGDKLVDVILEKYSSINSNIAALLKGHKSTKAVTVYSPQGGSGKTVISLNLCIQMAKMGLRVFYLGLESVNTLSLLANSENRHKNLSDLIFHLKENKGNIAVKINSVKSFNEELNISFFEPADCALDIDDMTENDIERLIFELKELGQFDVIVIDTDSVINKRNITLFNASDSILLISMQDSISRYKLNIFLKEMGKIIPQNEKYLFDKFITVINKCTSLANIDTYMINEANSFKIPLLNDLIIQNGVNFSINSKSSMNVYMKEIAHELIRCCGIKSTARE